MGNLGATEILLILFVVLIFFGAKKIPELAQGLGKGIREFKKATREIDDDVAERGEEDRRQVRRPGRSNTGGTAMFENIGGSELLVVLFVVFLFFGPKKLPELGKNLGKGIREFKNAMRGVQEDIEKATKID